MIVHMKRYVLRLFRTLQNAVQLLNEALIELKGTHEAVEVWVGLIAERRALLNVLGTKEAALQELANARTLGMLTLVSHLGNRVHVLTNLPDAGKQLRCVGNDTAQEESSEFHFYKF